MKKLLLTIAIAFYGHVLVACDACNLYEYTSLKNRSYAAFFFGSRLFNGYDHLGFPHRYTLTPEATFQNKGNHIPNVVIKPTQNDYELFRSYEFRVNININDKYNLMLILPLRYTTIYYDEVYPEVGPVTSKEIKLGGVSDLILGLERLNNYFGDMTHRLRYGIGIKMPTGEHEKRDVHNYMFDPVLQPGTGSWDFILRGSYVGVYMEKAGVSMFLNGRFNTKSTIKPNPNDSEDSQYKFGNRFNFNLNLFYVARINDLQIVPKSGIYYETAGYDRFYTTSSNRNVEATGGKTLFWNAGLDFNFKRVTLQTLWQRPVYESLNDNQIGNAGRAMIGLIYNFDL